MGRKVGKVGKLNKLLQPSTLVVGLGCGIAIQASNKHQQATTSNGMGKRWANIQYPKHNGSYRPRTNAGGLHKTLHPTEFGL